MSLLIDGTDGLIQAGPSTAYTTIGFVSKWKVSCKTPTTKRGPYIGATTIYKSRGGKESSGSLEFDIPQGRDVGVSALIAAHEAAANITVTLRAGGAVASPSVSYTYTAAVIPSGIDMSGDATAGFSGTFSFDDAAGYTLIPTT